MMMNGTSGLSNNQGNTTQLQRLLIKDNLYVIKVIDVAKVPSEVGLEALKEIELMHGLDSPFIVGYIDSFIDD